MTGHPPSVTLSRHPARRPPLVAHPIVCWSLVPALLAASCWLGGVNSARWTGAAAGAGSSGPVAPQEEHEGETTSDDVVESAVRSRRRNVARVAQRVADIATGGLPTADPCRKAEHVLCTCHGHRWSNGLLAPLQR